MKKIILSTGFLSLLLSQQVFSAESPWQDIKPSSSVSSRQLDKSSALKKVLAANVANKLTKFRSLSLNESLLKSRLKMSADAGLVNNKVNNRLARSASVDSTESIITIPLPDGKTVRVRLADNHLLPAGLAAKHPEIKTWDARGVDDPAINGVVDMTGYGFHAMLTMPDGDTVFVERADKNLSALYNSFSRRANPDSFKQDFHCLLHDDPFSAHHNALAKASRVAAREQAEPLINYRLAVAATGQYTQYHGGVGNALSAITTTINRVNEINERDLGIHFSLVDNEEDIIYTQPFSDPYTNNQADIMMGENIRNLQNTLGRSSYDIGHVFTQGDPSGLATLGAACDETSRARFPTANGGTISLTGVKESGTTGSPSPDGDAFDIDFVAHELGHQLGGRHTFNSNSPESGSCAGNNRTAQSAVEPGSGSTVMAYAGICGPNNLQKHSDAYYHTQSVAEIQGYTRNDSIGSSCGSRLARANNNPEPDAKSDMVIPASTPFVLTGSANDPDGDDMTYVWEQMDKGQASNVDVDTGDNALIRSLPPSLSANRFIPRLKDLFRNKFIRGERLPYTNREMNFAFTVRDGRGGIELDGLKVTVAKTGRPFKLASHGSSRSLGVGQQTKVSWDVANTNRPPVNCSAVDINLVQANGRITRAKTNTANDGSETISIPDNALGMLDARMMVACHRPASTFFNISSADLDIVDHGQGEPDSSRNNGGGSSSGGGNGGSGSSGGGSLAIAQLLILLLLALSANTLRLKTRARTQKIRIKTQDSTSNKHNNGEQV